MGFCTVKKVANNDGIAGWKIDSPIERMLAKWADKSEFGKYLYVNFYRIFDREYFEKGIKFIDKNIAYALCGSMCDDLNKDNLLYDRYACALLFYVHQGIIGRLEYPDFAKDPRVQDVDVQIWPGKQIQEDGSTGQCAIKLKLFTDTLDSLADMIRYAQENIVVEDIDGRNMLFKPFDPSCLTE